MAFLRGSMALLRHSSWRLHALSWRFHCVRRVVTARSRRSHCADGALFTFEGCWNNWQFSLLPYLSFTTSNPFSLLTVLSLYNTPSLQSLSLSLSLLPPVSTIPPSLSLSLCYPPLYLLLLSTPHTLSLYAPGKERAWVGDMGRGAWVV